MSAEIHLPTAAVDVSQRTQGSGLLRILGLLGSFAGCGLIGLAYLLQAVVPGFLGVLVLVASGIAFGDSSAGAEKTTRGSLHFGHWFVLAVVCMVGLFVGTLMLIAVVFK